MCCHTRAQCVVQAAVQYPLTLLTKLMSIMAVHRVSFVEGPFFPEVLLFLCFYFCMDIVLHSTYLRSKTLSFTGDEELTR